MSSLALLYMAAGKSSRFGGEPKMLCKLGENDESLFELSILQMKKYIKITHIHMVVNATNKDVIMSEVHKVNEKYNICKNVTYNIQEIPTGRSKPWGTADAAASAWKNMKEPFLMLNSDDLYSEETFKMVSHECDRTKNYVIGFKLGTTLMDGKKANRAFILLDKDGNVSELREKLNIEKAYYNNNELENQYVSVNLFLLQPEVLMTILGDLSSFKEKNEANITTEAMLPSFLNSQIKNGQMHMELLKTNGQWNGVTYKDDVKEVKSQLSIQSM